MAKLKALKPGDSVTIKFTTDFERHRIVTLRKNASRANPVPGQSSKGIPAKGRTEDLTGPARNHLDRSHSERSSGFGARLGGEPGDSQVAVVVRRGNAQSVGVKIHVAEDVGKARSGGSPCRRRISRRAGSRRCRRRPHPGACRRPGSSGTDRAPGETECLHVGEIALPAAFRDRQDVIGVPERFPAAFAEPPGFEELFARRVIELAQIAPQRDGVRFRKRRRCRDRDRELSPADSRDSSAASIRARRLRNRMCGGVSGPRFGTSGRDGRSRKALSNRLFSCASSASS